MDNVAIGAKSNNEEGSSMVKGAARNNQAVWHMANLVVQCGSATTMAS